MDPSPTDVASVAPYSDAGAGAVERLSSAWGSRSFVGDLEPWADPPQGSIIYTEPTPQEEPA